MNKKIGIILAIVAVIIIVVVSERITDDLETELETTQKDQKDVDSFAQERNSTRLQHMDSIATAVYSYAIEHGGNFPEECIGEPDNPTTIDENWCKDVLVPNYLREVPTDPQEGHHYQIEFSREKEAVKISSTAPETWPDEETGFDGVFIIK